MTSLPGANRPEMFLVRAFFAAIEGVTKGLVLLLRKALASWR